MEIVQLSFSGNENKRKQVLADDRDRSENKSPGSPRMTAFNPRMHPSMQHSLKVAQVSVRAGSTGARDENNRECKMAEDYTAASPSGSNIVRRLSQTERPPYDTADDVSNEELLTGIHPSSTLPSETACIGNLKVKPDAVSLNGEERWVNAVKH